MNVPRILPLIGVAVGGVLAINALAGARELPDLVSGARAWAETAAKLAKPAKPGKDAQPEAEARGDSAATPAAALPGLATPAAKPQPVCAPTAAELAKEAGLSPAELQVLQSLGERRGQLDQREADLNTQLALMAAAEAKLDAKVSALNGLKADIQNLLKQTDDKSAAEVDRLVKVFEGMKPKDAGPRMVLLDDSVRLPIAAKMKERSLSAILSQMPPSEAKKLTEALANRFAAAKALAANAQASAQAAAAQAAPAAPPAAKPVRQAKAKTAPPRRPARKAAPAAAQASAAAPPAPAKAAPSGAVAPAAAPAAKAG